MNTGGGKGKLVVFEGIKGAGKSTVAWSFYMHLIKLTGTLYDHDLDFQSEPEEACAAGYFIRKVLEGVMQTDNWTLAMAFAVNRRDHINRTLRPALDAGKTVICDRYLLSSLVYQGQGDWAVEEQVRELNCGVLVPDVTFFIDTDPKIAAARIAQRSEDEELFEDRGEEYRKSYLRLFQNFKLERDGCFLIVNGDGSPQEVLSEVVAGWESAKAQSLV